MIIPPESMPVFSAALVLLIGTAIVFGHRYTTQSSNFDEKSKTDELNEIRMAIRSDTTIPALDKLWRFLVITDQK